MAACRAEKQKTKAPGSASECMPGSTSSIPEEDAAGMEVDESKSSGISAWADMSTLASAAGVHEALARCLLNGLKMESGDDARCWQEGRVSSDKLQEVLGEPSSASPDARRARARMPFVSALAEWVNMHDNHKPYALGPPGKDQPCARVDHEHSTMERVHCNKLYLRKLIEAGMEEVAEDP